MFEDTDIIFSYSREQAIEDGLLIDVSGIAKEAGFKWSVQLLQLSGMNLSNHHLN